MLPLMVPQRLRKLCGALCLLLALCGSSSDAQVLVIYGASSPQYVADVQTKIETAGPWLGPVSIYNAGDSGSDPLPTLSALHSYAAVLVFSDSGGFRDPNQLGDLLADYVDSGGGVVDAVFANGSIPIEGRWMNGAYSALVSGGQSSGTALTLGDIADPFHPIMTGVEAFADSAAYRSTGGLRAGAVLIASWSNGEPLVALSPGFNGRVVTLNFFPPSSDARSDFWDSSTDGAKLLANSLGFVAIPEPSTYVLLALGLGVIVWLRRRR